MLMVEVVVVVLPSSSPFFEGEGERELRCCSLFLLPPLLLSVRFQKQEEGHLQEVIVVVKVPLW